MTFLKKAHCHSISRELTYINSLILLIFDVLISSCFLLFLLGIISHSFLKESIIFCFLSVLTSSGLLGICAC